MAQTSVTCTPFLSFPKSRPIKGGPPCARDLLMMFLPSQPPSLVPLCLDDGSLFTCTCTRFQINTCIAFSLNRNLRYLNRKLRLQPSVNFLVSQCQP
ncbi:hypothetical protein HanIR_Chr03g0132091 [Helianthus annuus]|nr:hypothetical protein HanIR_Chr03g0132091 [Helianthus annuus]